jgi:hypothetical protein
MWGVNEKETFVISANGLTTNFLDNFRIANLHQSDVLMLYANYEKGTEDKVEISIGYALSTGEQFFEESIIVSSNGKVMPFYHTLEQTGLFRLALPTTVSEARVKVSVRAQGMSFPFTGKLEFFYGTNNLRSQSGLVRQ